MARRPLVEIYAFLFFDQLRQLLLLDDGGGQGGKGGGPLLLLGPVVVGGPISLLVEMMAAHLYFQ